VVLLWHNSLFDNLKLLHHIGDVTHKHRVRPEEYSGEEFSGATRRTRRGC
jgi:hypothetical protein